MRLFILTAVILISTNAFAVKQAESYSVLCIGSQDAGGPKTGPFMVKASTPDSGVDASWIFEAGWVDENPILKQGVVCGMALPEGMQCLNQRAGGDGFALAQSCGPEVINGGIPDVQFSSQIVLTSETGYFNCQTAAGTEIHIQLKGCH